MLRPFIAALLVLLCSAPADAQRQPRRRAQVGLASFYGPGFHGDRTASGEVFDQRELVAAHRTLPLGSVVRVTNLENGRQVVLRIIDRGPFGRNHRKGCIIDVSRAAARQLGFVRDGLSRVRVDVLQLGPTSTDPQ
jgi:rare lipoprotein A